MGSFLIRDARSNDMAALLNLIQELADFEKEPDAVELNVEDLQRDGFGQHPKFHAFVAEANDNIVGAALVYSRYSTWKGPILHLEDLIVSEKMRSRGIGDSLLNAVVNYGYALGVKRISWEVLDWNQSAIDFYEKKGARVMRDWDLVQLDEKGIANFIKNTKKNDSA